MRKITITIDEDTDNLLTGLVDERGGTVSGMIRLSVKHYCKEKEVAPLEISEKRKKTQKISEETQVEYDEYILKDKLCPNHPTQVVSACGCIENGELMKKLVEFNGN